MSHVLNHEIARKDAGIRDYLATFKKVNNKQRQSQLNFNWDDNKAPTERKAKRPAHNHASMLTNGNIII